MAKGKSEHDSPIYNHQCPICNSNYINSINDLLTDGIKYAKIVEMFKDKVKITRYILTEHYHKHVDKALRADLIHSIKTGKLKVHSTAKKLFELIDEWESVYSIGKDGLIANMTDPKFATAYMNALQRLMTTQKDLLRFNAELLKQTSTDIAGATDLTQIAATLRAEKEKLNTSAKRR